MDDAMRMRFRKALEARGIYKEDWAEASADVIKPDGSRLGGTWIRDCLTRGKGKDEFARYVTDRYEIPWDHVKSGTEDQLMPPLPAAIVAHNNGLDDHLAAAKRLLGALSVIVNEGVEKDGELQLMLFAVIDAVEDKIEAAVKAIEATE